LIAQKHFILGKHLPPLINADFVSRRSRCGPTRSFKQIITYYAVGHELIEGNCTAFACLLEEAYTWEHEWILLLFLGQ
jgi:hypothetical protein